MESVGVFLTISLLCAVLKLEIGEQHRGIVNPHAKYTRRKLYSMLALCLRAVRPVIAGQSRVSFMLFLGLPQDKTVGYGNEKPW